MLRSIHSNSVERRNFGKCCIQMKITWVFTNNFGNFASRLCSSELISTSRSRIDFQSSLEPWSRNIVTRKKFGMSGNSLGVPKINQKKSWARFPVPSAHLYRTRDLDHQSSSKLVFVVHNTILVVVFLCFSINKRITI